MTKWPMVRLERLVIPIERPEIPAPGISYRQIGVKLWGEGAYQRETIDGGATKYKTFSRVEADDIIVNKIWARNGSVALVPTSLAGSYVSSEFPTFIPIREKLEPRWFHWICKTKFFWDQCNDKSRGTSGKNRIRPERFLEIEIPLPPPLEQRRIVARIEALAAKIEEARELNNKKAKDLDHLLICMAHRNDLDNEKKAQKSWRKIRLEAVLTLLDDSQPVYADKSYQNLGIYSFGRGLFHKTPIDGALTSAKTLRKVKKGQFIYSRLFAFEGAYGMVTDDFDERFVSNEYPTFDCQPSHIRCEFLSAYFKSPLTWELMAVGSKGLGHRRQRVQPEQILGHEIWLPPMKWQNQIAEAQSKLSDLYKHQTGCNNELGALLPSILDKAFRGGL